jgi:hypothetical protein
MPKRIFLFIVGVVLVLNVLYFFKRSRDEKEPIKKPFVYMPPEEVIPDPDRVEPLLHNSRVWYIDPKSRLHDTSVNGQKVLWIDGDIFLDISKEDVPLKLRTRLIDILISEPSEFRISGYDADQGQSIEVIKGNVRAAKSYESPWPEPDTLRDHNLYMINDSIDLSEKEKLDNPSLVRWWDRFKDLRPSH